MSPAFVLENPNGTTLCIPTAFFSLTGEALDHKTPVLRSQDAVATHAVRVLRLFGRSDPSTSYSTAGPSRSTSSSTATSSSRRPDLINAGRTLFGAKPPKGQEFDDHYFGAIPERVLGFMLDTVEKLGVPVKTRHNEVAPSQFEIAPMFERANVASDHQQLVMATFKGVAERYGLELLLHEKPFAGVNGSGKHVNWSLSDDLGNNLLVPARPRTTTRSSWSSCAAVLGGPKHGDLLRVAVAPRRQRPPAGGQRGPAGDHLDVPGRHAPGHRRPDREGGSRRAQGAAGP